MHLSGLTIDDTIPIQPPGHNYPATCSNSCHLHLRATSCPVNYLIRRKAPNKQAGPLLPLQSVLSRIVCLNLDLQVSNLVNNLLPCFTTQSSPVPTDLDSPIVVPIWFISPEIDGCASLHMPWRTIANASCHGGSLKWNHAAIKPPSDFVNGNSGTRPPQHLQGPHVSLAGWERHERFRDSPKPRKQCLAATHSSGNPA